MLDPRAGAFRRVDGLAHAQDSQLAHRSCAAPRLHGAYRDRGLARSQDFARRSRSGSGSPASSGAVARAGSRRLEIDGRAGSFPGAGPVLVRAAGKRSGVWTDGGGGSDEDASSERARCGIFLCWFGDFLSFGLRKNPEISLDNPGLLKLPFGVAVAAATVICYCAARWGDLKLGQGRIFYES